MGGSVGDLIREACTNYLGQQAPPVEVEGFWESFWLAFSGVWIYLKGVLLQDWLVPAAAALAALAATGQIMLSRQSQRPVVGLRKITAGVTQKDLITIFINLANQGQRTAYSPTIEAFVARVGATKENPGYFGKLFFSDPLLPTVGRSSALDIPLSQEDGTAPGRPDLTVPLYAVLKVRYKDRGWGLIPRPLAETYYVYVPSLEVGGGERAAQQVSLYALSALKKHCRKYRRRLMREARGTNVRTRPLRRAPGQRGRRPQL